MLESSTWAGLEAQQLWNRFLIICLDIQAANRSHSANLS